MADHATLPVTMAELAEAARARLPREIWDFAAGGSGDETTLAANLAAFRRIAVVPRVLTGGAVTTSARLLGTDVAMPVAVAPMAYQQLFHPAGELALAEAARRAGVPFVTSTMSSHSIEEIAKVGAAGWFQLYWLRDRAMVLELVRRAEASGATALMVTVDVPVMARRARDVRNRFALPPGVVPANLATAPAGSVAAHTNATFDAELSWSDLEWLRDRTGLPIVLKGLMDPRDAEAAVALGVDALVVSNHGGRQLACAPPSATLLPAVVEAVAGRAEVLLDSGVRRGADILRVLALGATGVLVGRPLLWGLSVAGTDGAAHVLSILHTELLESLRLTGCHEPIAARELRTIRTEHDD